MFHNKRKILINNITDMYTNNYCLIFFHNQKMNLPCNKSLDFCYYNDQLNLIKGVKLCSICRCTDDFTRLSLRFIARCSSLEVL